jgi:large subunit ribosomal protein L17
MRKVADNLVTLAVKGDLHSRRQAYKVLGDHGLVKRLFDDIGPRFAGISGGYTRVVKLGLPRPGDAAKMAVIEFSVRAGETAEKETGKKGKKAKAKKEEPAKTAKKAAKKAEPKVEEVPSGQAPAEEPKVEEPEAEAAPAEEPKAEASAEEAPAEEPEAETAEKEAPEVEELPENPRRKESS